MADICCGMLCIDHSFFLTMSRSFPADEYIAAFLDELSAVGIDYEVRHSEPLRLCGMEPFKSC